MLHYCFLFIYYYYEYVDLFGKKGILLRDSFQMYPRMLRDDEYVSTHTYFLTPQYNTVMSVLLSLGW